MVMVIPQLSHRCTMRSLVSMACIATEHIGQALGGVKAWCCRSMRPITVPNDLCRIDLDQKGPPQFKRDHTDGKRPVPPTEAASLLEYSQYQLPIRPDKSCDYR